MPRMGFCLNLRPGTVEEYKRLHANVWPEVLDAIARANITNYSIFLKEPENLLFGYWEYTEMISPPIWRRWPRASGCGNGGQSANPCNCPSRRAGRKNGGRR